MAAGGWRLAAGGWRLAAGGCVLAALSACGGGTSPTAPTISLQGVAATGQPLAAATITAQCVSGSAQATSSAEGAYTLNLPADAAFPCVLQAQTVAPATALSLQALALQAGTANLTPLTTLQWAITGGNTSRADGVAAWLASHSAAGAYTSTASAAAWAQVKARLLMIGLDAAATATLNALAAPATVVFVAASPDAHDHLLDQLALRLAANGLSLDALLAQLLNQAPVGSFTASSNGLTVSFNAAAARDADGTVARYHWSFGTGGAVLATASPTTSFTFAASGTYTVSLEVTDNLGAAGSVYSQTVTVAASDAIPTGAVLGELTLADYGGVAPMMRLNADGSRLDNYPLGPSAIRNPEYGATATCFTVDRGTIPNCYDPIHSYWAIETAAIDPLGRILTYSISVAGDRALVDPIGMRQQLRINSLTGLITQTCVNPVGANLTGCYDSFGTHVFTITVIAQPTGGAIPLERTFKIAVWDQA